MQHEWKLKVDVEVAVDCEYECEVDSNASTASSRPRLLQFLLLSFLFFVFLLSQHDDIIKLALCSVAESLFCSALHLSFSVFPSLSLSLCRLFVPAIVKHFYNAPMSLLYRPEHCI